MYGKCGLCRKKGEILDSHLVPAGFYRLLLTKESINPNPVAIKKGQANTTSDQIKGHFLCPVCEKRFNQGGEKYILDRCHRAKNNFKLLEEIRDLPSKKIEENVFVHQLSSNNSELISKCTYFAASVFWRASARHWRSYGRVLDMTKLGPYEEDFRLFLLGEGPFPPKSILELHVSDAEEPENLILFPETVRTKGRIRHKFYVAGLLFILFVGGTVPDRASENSLSPAGNTIFYGSLYRDQWFAHQVRKILDAERVGKFGKKT